MCGHDEPLNQDEFLLPDNGESEYGSVVDDEAWAAIENDPQAAKLAADLMASSLRSGIADDDDEVLQ
jgi:hypothetical protein